MSYASRVQEYYKTNYSKCKFSDEFFPFIADTDNYVFSIHIVCLFFVPIYIFGGYCILYKTSKPMSPLKIPLFLNHIWSCVHDLTICYLLTPVYFLPTIAGTAMGILHWLDVPPGIQMYLIQAVGYTVLVAMTGLFENRSSCISDNQFRITRTSTKVAYNVVRLIIYQNYMAPFFLNMPDPNKCRLELLQILPCPVPEFFTHPIITFGTDRSYLQYIEVMSPGFVFIESLQAFFFACCCIYYLFLKENGQVSPQTRQMQIRFFYGVVAQCFVPLAFLAFPCGSLMISYYFGFQDQGAANILMILLSTHGFVQTIVIIAIHRPYRDFAFSFFGCSWKPRRITFARWSIVLT